MPRGTKHCNGCIAFTSRLVAFRRPSSSGKLIMYAGVEAIEKCEFGAGHRHKPPGAEHSHQHASAGHCHLLWTGAPAGHCHLLVAGSALSVRSHAHHADAPPACHFESSNRAPPALLSLEMGVPCSSSSWKGRRRSRGALLVAHAPSDKGLSAYQALTWGSLAPYRDPGATHGRGARAWTGAQQPGSGRWAGTATTVCPRTNAFAPNRLRPQAQ